MAHILTTCHQIPSPAVVMHHLGIFYYWHIWQPTVDRWTAHIVCRNN